MSDLSSGQWLQETLRNESTKKYFIEFDNFKSNHMAHGIIALYRLGASKSRIQQFIEWYSQKMEPPDYADHKGENPDVHPADDKQLNHLLGKRNNYYAICNRFERNIASFESLDLFVRSEFPKLSRGLSCAAFHGLIHIGYGFSADSANVVCEGMAYIHHSYKPLVFDSSNPANDICLFGKGSFEIKKVLEEIRSDKELRKRMLEGANDYAKGDWIGSTFEYRTATLMLTGNELVRYCNKIKIPGFGDKSNFDRLNVIEVADWLICQAIAVYTLSERKNDFFLLHGVTSAWALKQLVPVLKHSDAVDALRTFLCALMAAYLAQDSPTLVKITTETDKTDEDVVWKTVIGDALSCDRDEHIYKLIQVSFEVWRENRDSSCGTLCITVAKSCLNNNLCFI